MNNMVKPGIYTLQCEASSRYLDTRREDLGDGLYQNRLLLWETAGDIAKVSRPIVIMFHLDSRLVVGSNPCG